MNPYFDVFLPIFMIIAVAVHFYLNSRSKKRNEQAAKMYREAERMYLRSAAASREMAEAMKIARREGIPYEYYLGGNNRPSASDRLDKEGSHEG